MTKKHLHNDHGAEHDVSSSAVNDAAEKESIDEMVDSFSGSEILENQKKEIESLKGRLLRLQADFDNFKRRTKEDSEKLALFVSADLISMFLPVADNFERAISTSETQDADSLRKGMELIFRQFEKSFKDVGVEKIPALGEEFSPDLHEAVMSAPNSDLADGTIEAVFEDGYKIKDKVIRHSKVKVVNNS